LTLGNNRAKVRPCIFARPFFFGGIIMAKVSGALFSMEASGGFGGAMVFARRLGQQVVRQLVTPANPMSAGQETARNAVRVCGAAQKFANTSVLMGEARIITDKAALQADTPAGQTWNSYLVKLMTGAGNVNYLAGSAIWTALAAGEKTAWNVAAAALTPVILDVAQKAAGGVPSTAMTAGQVFLQYQYGLFAGGIASIPSAVPPVYA
jgi:hypothetical protein